jgi:hypothetical protein
MEPGTCIEFVARNGKNLKGTVYMVLGGVAMVKVRSRQYQVKSSQIVSENCQRMKTPHRI